jgi:hypothetical protein
MVRQVPEAMRRLNDVALSGNGEPTSAAEFAGRGGPDRPRSGGFRAWPGDQAGAHHQRQPRPQGRCPGRRPRHGRMNGEVWFKFDRATRAGMPWSTTPKPIRSGISSDSRSWPACAPPGSRVVSSLWTACPPMPMRWRPIWPCWRRCRREIPDLAGVMLYGLARPSLQPEAGRLGGLPAEWLEELGGRVEALGLQGPGSARSGVRADRRRYQPAKRSSSRARVRVRASSPWSLANMYIPPTG